MTDTIRLEEFTGIIGNKVIAVWSTESTASPWLPTEFLLTQYITRILIVGRTSSSSNALAADPSWTQVWRSPGAKEWSCLFGILQHMPGPVLCVVGPDITLTPKVIVGLKDMTSVVLRIPGPGPGSGHGPGPGWPAGAEPAGQVFFPVLGDRSTASIGPIIQEWITKAVPRSLDLKTLVPQLASAGYGLTVADGVWHWYKPADSLPLVTLTIPQIAKQIQILGTTLEHMVV